MNRCLLSMTILLFGIDAANAIYIRPEIEKVPVARLIENLEKRVAKEPKDIQARLNLARLHAMAYSLKSDTCEILKGKEMDGAWFGYEPKPIPYDKVVKTDDAGKQDAARKHLEKAINIYDTIVKEKADHLIAQLGRAWCIAQRAGKEETIKVYRTVIDLAWAKEKDLKVAGLGFHAITSETSKYLIPLLDADKDKEEIATLKKRSEQLDKLPRPITPIAIPLRDDMTASEMLDHSARVRFDADGSGLARDWTWIRNDAGWLVYDPSRGGKITSALQMFGSVSFWCFWDNGYEALATLDDDGDGWLRGKELDGLAIWRDVDGDGNSDPGEVKPLADWGIVALRCRADAVAPTAAAAAKAEKGVVFRDGKVRPTFDLVLHLVDNDPTKPAFKGIYANRGAAQRAKAVEEFGGNKESETAVARGLRWLAVHQAADGHWGLEDYNKHARKSVEDKERFDDQSKGFGQKNDTAGTAFGLLPFLAVGITHKPTGRKAEDVYVKTVKGGLDFLLQKQARDGSFPGGMYAHPIATIAVCEAYGLSGDPLLRRSAQAAITYIINAQDPKGGGWRYAPRQGSDTSVTGWHLQALKSGQAAGLNVPKGCFDAASKWLASCATQDGGYGYTGPQETPTMTAVGILSRQLLGTPMKDPGLAKGIEKLKKTPPGAQRNSYHEYYATLAFFHMGGDAWDFWNKGEQGKRSMRDELIKRQDADGSWGPQGDAFAGTGGRIMSTSLSLLNLQVYYRHAPANGRAIRE